MRPRERASALPLGALMPMLDTLFLLLFALLVSQTQREARAADRAEPATPTEEVRVELPTVARADAAPGVERPRIALAIDAASRVTAAATDARAARPEGPPAAPVDSPAALDALLARRLAELGVPPREVVVELRADRDARHGTVAALLQHLRLAGFTDVELLAEGGATPTDAFDARAPGAGARTPNDSTAAPVRDAESAGTEDGR